VYCDHFKLKERPFTHAPGQRFYTPNAGVTDALGRLQHLLTARDSIGVVTGGPGVGKTTLAECALKGMTDSAAIVRVDMRYGEPEDLCAAILLALDVDAAGLKPVQAMNTLRQMMMRLMREDKRLVLCLDVGGISVDVAKHLLRVVNLSGEHDCQMNILLMGPHPLHQQLDLPALIQVRQRIAFRHRVRPLTLTETDRYIRHQIEAIGGDPTALISSNVAAAVYCYVAGVPRLINTLLDATLSEAAMQKLQRPDGGLIKRTADSLGWKPMTPPQTAAETSQRPASRPSSSGSSKPAASERPRGGDADGRAPAPKRPELPLPPASELTLQLRSNGSGAAGANVPPPPASLASEGRSPTAAIFGASDTADRPVAPHAGSVPLMDANDTSATGMLRLQDLDERFAESIFGKDAEEKSKKTGN
jgi:general secretion pathway protein A